MRSSLLIAVLFLQMASAESVWFNYLYGKIEEQTVHKKSIDRQKLFTRESFMALKKKKRAKKALVVHIFVPLCDNIHQNIVPVPKSLGDGMNLRTNLYWGAMYGVKRYFQRAKAWKQVFSQKPLSSTVLERVVFKKGNTYIVADAYRGDKMKEALIDYFDALSGRKGTTIKVKKQTLGLYKDADLTIFNGHNGLMDYRVTAPQSKDKKIRETMVIGCKSYDYFKRHLLRSRAYPLLTTTNFMAPEAYILKATIESWEKLHSQKRIKTSAAKAYNHYQKCGLKGATRLFRAGWKR